MKTSELTGHALDWAVAKCEGGEFHMRTYRGDNPGPAFPAIQWPHDWQELTAYSPSTDWAEAGPIIQREGISLEYDNGDWTARIEGNPMRSVDYFPLVAAMRLFVSSKIGNEVNVPKELL